MINIDKRGQGAEPLVLLAIFIAMIFVASIVTLIQVQKERYPALGLAAESEKGEATKDNYDCPRIYFEEFVPEILPWGFVGDLRCAKKAAEGEIQYARAGIIHKCLPGEKGYGTDGGSGYWAETETRCGYQGTGTPVYKGTGVPAGTDEDDDEDGEETDTSDEETTEQPSTEESPSEQPKEESPEEIPPIKGFDTEIEQEYTDVRFKDLIPKLEEIASAGDSGLLGKILSAETT